MTHLQICTYITQVLTKFEDETTINQEKTMARKLSVVIKIDKSDNESALARQGRSVVCKRNTRLKCQKSGVKLGHD